MNIWEKFLTYITLTCIAFIMDWVVLTQEIYVEARPMVPHNVTVFLERVLKRWLS